MNLTQYASGELKLLREKADSEFHAIFIEAKYIANKIESPLNIPRKSFLQKSRIYMKTDPNQYYRTDLYIPYLDSFNYQLKSRFMNHTNILNCFHSLFDTYKEEFASPTSVLIGEFQLCQKMLNNMSVKANNAIYVLNICNKDM